MTIGWVYIAVTESFPGDCKVGFTLGPVEVRMAQLQRQYRTRHRFTASDAWRVKHPRRVEWLAQKRLAGYRTPRTELFECSAEIGKSAVLWAIDQVIDEERRNPTVITPRPERAPQRWRRARPISQDWLMALAFASLITFLIALVKPNPPPWLPNDVQHTLTLIDRLPWWTPNE